MSAPLPVIVSYYTTATPYEALAARLRASCERLGLAHHIVALDSRGSWEANTYAKARVCQTAWRELGQPILWVDADAIVHAAPELLRTTADVAVHKWKGQYFASGTVFFNQTSGADLLLSGWVERCATNRGVSDQPHLEHAWNALVRVHPLQTLWLPRSYCQIFDAPRVNGEAAVIEHFQASRTQPKRAQEAVR